MKRPSLTYPARNDVNLALAAIEAEDERRREAVVKFYAVERERAARRHRILSRIVFGAIGVLSIFGIVWLAVQAIAPAIQQL
jgi:hypothetical protein